VPNVVTITDLDHLGRGLVVLGEEKLTVPGALIGETVSIRLVDKPGRPRATVSGIEHPSPYRISTDCTHAEDCPGCTLRHVGFEASRQLKLDRLRRALTMSDAPPEIQWLGSAERDGYRTRAIARALITQTGQLRLGMVGYHGTVPLGSCPVQASQCQTLINDLEADFRRLGLTHYDPLTRAGQIRHVIVDAYEPMSNAPGPTQRVVICLGRPVEETWSADTFLAEHQETAILVDTLAYRSPGLLRKPIALRHGSSVHFEIDGDVIRSSLPAWCPQSPSTLKTLRDTIIEWLAPEAHHRILEVGCGSGSNTLAMARRAHTVIALDNCRAAIADTQANARRAKINNIESRIGHAEKAIGRIFTKVGGVDLAVCHGMRLPFGERAMASLSCLEPERIVMIGPSANSLSADIKQLNRYTLTRSGVLDQTPGTSLGLCILLLIRK